MNHIIILAAGKGTRMKSDLPKVLHPVLGTPIIERLISNIKPICETPTLIIGHKAEEVRAATGNKYQYVEQKEQLGTGHAIMMAKEDLKDKDFKTIMVLMGDHPLLTAETLNKIVNLHETSQSAITMVTVNAPDFDGNNALYMHYGRVIRNTEGLVDRIVEYKDATDEERAVKEVNFGTYCFDAQWLWENIDNLTNNNAAQEYYLTDMIKMAINQGKKVSAYVLDDMDESYGINTPEQLKMVEEVLLRKQNKL